MCDLNGILQNLGKIKDKGKINLYALKYLHRPKTGNFAVSLPSNQNTDFVKKYCDSLGFYRNFKCEAYNPLEKKEDTYEFLAAEQISSVWDDMLSMINGSDSLKQSPHRDELLGANLTICKLVYDNKEYWIATQQQKTESLFKGKFPFLDDEGELVAIEPKHLLTLSFYIDFIVCENDGKKLVYVFNRKNFEKIFNYYDLLKKHVSDKSDVIEEWGFLDNPDFIKEKVETGYVYKGLARIIDNTDYLNQIKNTKPNTLKTRLLEKCADSFTEADFSGDKLLVTKSNLENIIKMLSKGFRYNFFADKAED